MFCNNLTVTRTRETLTLRERDHHPLDGRRRLQHFSRHRTSSTPLVQTCKELADRHRDNPTKAVDVARRERDGWENECFAPTWFVFEGEPLERRAAPPRIGAGAPDILCGARILEDAGRLIAGGVVAQPEWIPVRQQSAARVD